MKWALRSLLAAAAAVVLIGLVVAFIAGTESGTRWALEKAGEIIRVDIEMQGVSGTLLGDLAFKAIRYSDTDRTIVVDDFALNIDWSRTSLAAVAFEQLAIRRFELQSTGGDRPDTEPPNISMPTMPIAISADDVAIDSLVFGDVIMEAVSATRVAVHGQQIEAGHAVANIDNLLIEVTGLKTQLAGNVPIDGTVEWRITDALWSGQARLSGNLGSLQVWASIAGTEAFSMTVDGSISVDAHGMDEIDLELATPFAHVLAKGQFQWLPQLGLDLQLETGNLDPSALVPVSTGTISSKVHLTATSVDNFIVDIVSLGGTWNGQRATGNGRISRSGDAWQCVTCIVDVGANRVALDGSLNAGQLAGTFALNAPNLKHLWPDLAGSLAGKGRVTGSTNRPVLSGNLSGSDLEYGNWQVSRFLLQSGGSTPENIDVAIEVGGLGNGDAKFGGGDVRLEGPPSSVDLTLQWVLDEYAVDAQLLFAVDENRVEGRVQSAIFSEPFSGSWRIEEPVQFRSSPGLFKVEPAVWTNKRSRLSLRQVHVADDVVSIVAKLTDGSLSALNPLLPEQVNIAGFVDASINVSQRDDAWTGVIDWHQRETRVLLGDGSNDEFLFEVPVAGATLLLQDDALELRATLNANPDIEATLDASLTDLSGDAELDARLQMNGDEWDWISLLIPDIENVQGLVTADVHANGKLSAPNFSGELRWRNGQLAMPLLNLPLSDIDITVAGSPGGNAVVSGEATAGDGSLAVTGGIQSLLSGSPSFKVQINGDEAALLNWPDYQLTASPDLTFAGDIQGVSVTGKVALDRAEIVISELPEGAVTPSDDVTVEGREVARKDPTRIHGEVEIALSDYIHIKAFGLDTNLAGQLRFSVPENGDPGAEGEVRLVGGVFEAYGQRLEIERGTLVFTGPLDNPIINVRATREIESSTGSVTAGIILTGRAQNLSSTIFSEPAMSEADALSYMVLGRPLEEATTSDGNALSNTAYSLGLRQAALISNQIGQTIGLDELTVAGENQNTTELVAGKQVSQDLYVRYAYGVFTRLGKLLLRYRLSDSFVIEVGAGETQSMDVLYTIEQE